MSLTILELQAPFEPEAVDLRLPCWDEDPDLFFAESPAEVELAKIVCGPCPVRDQCLASAIERREPHGVWGGQLLVQGEVVARKRPRGRPRKIDVPAAA
ncbi:MAG TPA: WhiB family transcriptional regulator [Propionibacteriaceae bacterium]|nr:WhiB family transcriptional regulator [Propionibacteriaceae bacterium]